MPTPAPHDHGALVLSFDDTFVTEWVAALPIFADTGAHVTFFVSHPDRVIASQRAELEKLVAAGHAIGCHSLRHEKAVDAVAKDGLHPWLERDVLPALTCLRHAGFRITSFAYPSSQNDASTDAALLQLFRHLRTGRALEPGRTIAQTDHFFTPAAAIAGRGCLPGTSLDYSGLEQRPHGVVHACEAIDRARARREILVLYAHNISDSGRGHHIPPAALRSILAHAQSVGLPAITYNDLP